MKILRSSPIRTHRNQVVTNWVERLLTGRQSRRRDGLNEHMFKEDFLNIIPFRTGTQDDIFKIDTNDVDLADRFLSKAATRRWRSNEHLASIFEETAQSLIWYGKAIYLVEDKPDSEGFQLLPFGPENIIRAFQNFVQYVPLRAARKSDGSEQILQRELRLLDRQRVLYVKWAAPIRRKISTQNKILRTLDKYDTSVALSFQPIATHGNPNPHTDFDFVRWRKAHDVAFYRATRYTGWNGRKYDHELRSDFFDCYRLIRFRKMQTQFRDSILHQLSNEITRVGKQFNADFTLKLSASDELLSIESLNEIEVRLSREEATFEEVKGLCYR